MGEICFEAFQSHWPGSVTTRDYTLIDHILN